MQNNNIRKKDRPLYVPPQARSESKLTSEAKQVELAGRFGKIGDYEFEYTNKSDADFMASILKKKKLSLEGGVTYHFKHTLNSDLKEKEKCEKPICVMRADIYEEKNLHKKFTPSRHILEGLDLMTPHNQKSWHKGEDNGHSQKDACVKDLKVSSDTQGASDGYLDNKYKNNDIIQNSKKKLPTDANKNKNLYKSENNKNSELKGFKSEPVVENYLPTIMKLYPHAASRRLLSACWISVFCFKLQEKKKLQKDFYINAIKTFENILKNCTDLSTAEAKHFYCHLNIILGDVYRYCCRYLELTPTEDTFKEFCYSQSLKYYKEAELVFPQEGHLYSQWANLAAVKDDYMTQIMYILRSCLSIFACKNTDVLTVILAQKGALDERLKMDTCDFILSRFLHILESVLMRLRLDHFYKDFSLFIELLQNNYSVLSSSKMQVSYCNIVNLLLLTMIETSGVWEKQQQIGKNIADYANSINFALYSSNSSDNLIYDVSDMKNYEQIQNCINNEYQHIRLIYTQEFQDAKLNLDSLIEANEQLKFSCVLICKFLSCLFQEALQSPVSSLWNCIIPLLLWIAHSKLLYITDSSSIYPLISLIKNQINKSIEVFHKELGLNEISYEYLQYKCAGESWLTGFIPIPVCFYSEKSSTDITDYNYASVIRPNKTTPNKRSSSVTRKKQKLYKPDLNTYVTCDFTDLEPVQNDPKFLYGNKECPISELCCVRFARLKVLSNTLDKILVPPVEDVKQEKLSGKKLEKSIRGGKIHLKASLDILNITPNTAINRRVPARLSKQVSPDVSEKFIIIDGDSLGSRLGDEEASEKTFKAYNIELAFRYYREKNYQCMIIASDLIMKFRSESIAETFKRLEGYVTTVPPQNSSWVYMILLAEKNNACILSNNFPKKESGIKLPKNKLRWLKSRIISFTFVNNEFLPNPDFKFPGFTS